MSQEEETAEELRRILSVLDSLEPSPLQTRRWIRAAQMEAGKKNVHPGVLKREANASWLSKKWSHGFSMAAGIAIGFLIAFFLLKLPSVTQISSIKNEVADVNATFEWVSIKSD